MKRAMILVVVVAVVAGGAYFLFGRGGEPAAAQAPADVAAQDEPVKASSDVTADAVVLPARHARLSLAAAGIVAEVLASEGDPVDAGAVLVRLDAARQQAAVVQAEANLQRAESALAQIKAGARPEEIAAASAALDAARAGLARVQAGPRAEEVRASEAAVAGAKAGLAKVREGASEELLAAATADVANAEAALRQAQFAYDRVKDLPDIGARPESLMLEQATNSYTAALARYRAMQTGGTAADQAGAEAQLRQAQAQLDALTAGARPADMESAEAEVRRAEALLAQLQAGARTESIAAAEAEVAAAAAALKQAEAALAETELRAPFAGTVAAVDVRAGELVRPGEPVVTVADLGAWVVETDDLTEIGIVRVVEGGAATISFDAIPGLELRGTVTKIKPLGEEKLGDMTYEVTIVPEASDPRIRWNMTATVVIAGE